MFTKMMVPLDGSDLAEGILPYVTHFAKGLGIPITLLTVIDQGAFELPKRSSVMASESEMFGALERMVKERLDGVAAALMAQGVNASTTVAHGKPEEQIVRTAQREGCDIIAMSTHGRNMIARGVLGSITNKVMHSSGIPVLTIAPNRAKEHQDNPAQPISGLLAPLDGSELAESSIESIADLALKMRLNVTLVRAVQLGGAYSSYVESSAFVDARIQAEIEDEAQEYLQGVADDLQAQGIEVDCQVVTGTPSIVITQASNERQNDVIVLTTHGRSGFSRFVLGSVAETLIRTSGAPVLVLNSQEALEGLPATQPA